MTEVSLCHRGTYTRTKIERPKLKAMVKMDDAFSPTTFTFSKPRDPSWFIGTNRAVVITAAAGIHHRGGKE